MEDVSPTFLEICSSSRSRMISLDAESRTVRGEKYEKMIKAATNTYQNADSYRVFGALCARDLYKRALSQDDPVRPLSLLLFWFANVV